VRRFLCLPAIDHPESGQHNRMKTKELKGGHMKKNICYVLMAAILLLVSAGPLYSAEKIQTETRFQLFNAEYNSALIQTSKTTVFTEKKLFKIDTQTGETWMLIDVFKEGQDIKYWKKIKEATGK
jgi:hypothetical protein